MAAPDPFLAPEMIWIADGKIHGYRAVGDGWQIYDGDKWREPTKQESNERTDWSPQLVHPSTD
jgi:hypothetical protein